MGDITIIESAAGDTYVPEADQVGTITKVLDSSAVVANSYTYDAFGVARSASEAFANPYRFAGKPLDADSGLSFFPKRTYSPALGRFLSVDPLHHRDRGRKYYYCIGRPVSLLDVIGFQELPADFVDWLSWQEGRDLLNDLFSPEVIPWPEEPLDAETQAEYDAYEAAVVGTALRAYGLLTPDEQALVRDIFLGPQTDPREPNPRSPEPEIPSLIACVWECSTGVPLVVAVRIGLFTSSGIARLVALMKSGAGKALAAELGAYGVLIGAYHTAACLCWCNAAFAWELAEELTEE